MFSAANRRLVLVALPLVLLGGCVSQQKYNALDAQYQQLQSSLSGELAANEVHITRLQNAVKVSVNSQLLFPSGGWQMPSEAAQTIAKMAPILIPNQQNKVIVDGYTDDTPIGPELAAQGITSNQILSQKRADTVMNYLISQGMSPSMVSARGFGDANPLASNDTAEGRAQNRRVEITLAAPSAGA